MPVIRIPVRSVDAQAWEGYSRIRTKLGDDRPGTKMPSSVTWFEPEAADQFKVMQEACGYRMQFTDMYRSVKYQARARARAKGSRKYRLLAPPSKSGHNFAWSFDLAVKETLLAFRHSGIAELIAAGQNRQKLGAWMRQFGWVGIRKEAWHFNYLGDFTRTTLKINAKYGDAFKLSDRDVQRCLNALLGKSLEKPLVVDGMLGKKSLAAAKMAGPLLDLTRPDWSAFSAWFRRVLAGATAVLVDVDA